MTILKPHHTTMRARSRHSSTLSTTLADAFADDPVFAWAMPSSVAERRAALPVVFDHFVAGFAPLGETWTTLGGLGAALWAPPGGAEPDLSGLEPVGERWPRMFEVMGLLQSTHPHEPVWYLNLLGVRAYAQGRGVGSSLLRAVLDRADEAGEPAYLEATSEANRRLYERHGFECTAELRVSDCPPLYAMWRRPVPFTSSHAGGTSTPIPPVAAIRH